MVYAQLIHTQLNAVINFLCSVPGPNGETALEFVLTKWVERQFLFYGAYETKVSIVALAKLLQYGVASNDTRLQDINVRGDWIENEARTRSQKRANPDEWTIVPVLVKLFKLLIQELASNMDEVLENSEDESEEEEENGGEMLSPDSNRIASKVALKEIMEDTSKHALFDDDDDDEEDPDAMADPIYKISLKKYLTEFVTEFSQQPFFQHHFALHLNQSEKSTLASVGVNV